MPREVFSHDPVERFVVGTVGMPGERTFYIQARTGARISSVVLEKEQVSLLTARLTELLADVRRSFDVAVPEPGAVDLNPLELPLTAEFRVAAIAFGWDPMTEKVLFELHAESDDDTDPTDLDDEADGPPLVRIRATPQQVVDFVARAERVVAAGRPPCPFCQQPLDPRGHVCPRANGYRR